MKLSCEQHWCYRSGEDDLATLSEESVMAWVVLFVAGLFEVGWAVGLKWSAGFTRLWPSVFTVCAMAVSLGLLGVALRSLPLGTAYAVWTGIGAVGTVVVGVLWFGDAATFARPACVGLIIAGIVGLKITTQVAPPG